MKKSLKYNIIKVKRKENMAKENKKRKTYPTTNFHIASWLLQNSIELKEIDWTNKRRAQFIFEDFEDREVLIQDFFKDEKIQRKIIADQELKARMYAVNPPIEYERPK